MAQITFREANRRYRRSFWLAMTVYAVVCLGGAYLIKTVGLQEKWFAAFIAVLTAAPMAGVFWLIGRLLKETDEYTRKIQTEALLTGGMITLSAAFAWSFLELYQVVPQAKYFPSMMFVGPAFFLFYGLAFCVKRMRSGEPACET